VTVTTDSGLTDGTVLTNNATVSSSTPDPDNGNNSTSEDTTIGTGADLSITKTDSIDPVIAGNNLTYTITVNNAGPNDALNVVVTDTLPAGVTFVSTAGCAEDPNGIPTCSLGTITAGGSAQYTATVTVDPDTTGSEDTAVNTEADLSVTKSDSPDPVDPGQSLTYTIMVNNAGPSDAQNVVVTDTLPAGVTFVSTTGCAEDPNGVPTCSLGTIIAGSSDQYAVTVTVDSGTTGTLTNNVSVSSDANDPNTGNNDDSEDTTVNAPSIFDPPSSLKTVNDLGFPELEWRMVWINNSNVIATAVRVTDPIPLSTTYVPASVTCDARGSSATTTCTYDSINNQVVWEGTIAPDPGATSEFDAANEVVITFSTSMSPQITFVENQGCANWDENGDGFFTDEIITGQTPVCSDDPATAPADDPTVWTAAAIKTIPTMNELGMIIFMLFAGIASLFYLRRQRRV
jgi:uncharacterized repeat protein (TIGR01451 family)